MGRGAVQADKHAGLHGSYPMHNVKPARCQSDPVAHAACAHHVLLHGRRSQARLRLRSRHACRAAAACAWAAAAGCLARGWG